MPGLAAEAFTEDPILLFGCIVSNIASIQQQVALRSIAAFKSSSAALVLSFSSASCCSSANMAASNTFCASSRAREAAPSCSSFSCSAASCRTLRLHSSRWPCDQSLPPVKEQSPAQNSPPPLEPLPHCAVSRLLKQPPKRCPALARSQPQHYHPSPAPVGSCPGTLSSG